MDKFKLPGFAFKEGDDMVYIFPEYKMLQTTTVKILAEDNYKDYTLIDSEGKVFKIKRAFFVKYLGLWGWNPMINLNPFNKGDREILVDFEFESPIGRISLEDFKKELIPCLYKRKEYWQESWDMDELEETINRCVTFKQIARWLWGAEIK